MKLISPFHEPDYFFSNENPIWYIYFEGSYDEPPIPDSMYGTYGEAIIDATTGEVLWVNVHGEKHIPPCAILIPIFTIIDIFIVIRIYKKILFNKRIESEALCSEQGVGDSQGPAEERKGGSP